MNFDLIAFDADDTLWHNETLYHAAQVKLAHLLAQRANNQTVEQKLYETEINNLNYYGYGIKSFTLSMIETAIKLTDGQITGAEIEQIIGFGRDMLTADVRLLDQVEETITTLATTCPLMIITKGDLLDQRAKLARSPLIDCFHYVEVVSQKDRQVYADLLAKYNIAAGRFLMVGNSLKSDILPVLALGGHAIYIPYHLTWAHEVESQPVEQNGYYELEHIGQLPRLLQQLNGV